MTDYCSSVIHTGNYTGACGQATPCPDHDKPRMSVAEIALMREIVRWRKAHGWLYQFWGARWVESRSGRAVTYESGDGEVGVTPNYHIRNYRWYPVESVTQAVDVLVAFGYLPARFSSAYRAGWDACDTLHTQHQSGLFIPSAKRSEAMPAGGSA